ncbi:amino acid adenylation domain-containing protein [Paenibacillus sp. Z6-24]
MSDTITSESQKLYLIEKTKSSQQYWSRKLNELSPQSFEKLMIYDYSFASGYEPDSIDISIDQCLTEKIFKMTSNNDLLIFTIWLAVLQIQQYQLTRQNLVNLIPTYDGGESDVLHDAGILPITNYIQPNHAVKEIIGHCKKELSEGYKNQGYAKTGKNALCYGEHDILQISQFGICMNTVHSVESIQNMYNRALNHIHILVKRQHDQLKLEITYNGLLFDKKQIVTFFEQYIHLIGELMANVNGEAVRSISLSTAQKKQVMQEFNPVHHTPSIERTLAEVLEAEVERCSQQPAVISGSQQLTYEELNRRANQLAHCLRQQGVQPDEPVPVLCSKSIDTIVAIVGIIKAGGAYVPIDDSYPSARICYLLTDSQARFLVGSPGRGAELGLDHLPIHWIDLSGEQVDRSPIHNPASVNRPTDLAYIIYTSGTTGNPKGVCVEQRSVVKNTKYPSYMQIRDTDRMLQAGSLSFDAAVLPIWSALLHGIPLHLEEDELVHAFHELSAYIRESGITLAVLPTTLFNQLSREYPETFAGMRYVVAGGDVISASQVSRLVGAYPELHIVNGYGPTENTVISTAYTIQGSWEEDRTVPIGRPVSHSTAYVMNEQLQLLPAGIAGELVVGGAGVARGYWNREQLTAEQFVVNPYVEGERLYRTGDLVRWQADGQLSFLGRIDQQVKIRGHRIEVSEIEKQLEGQAAVREAVVAVRKEPAGEAVLYGYVVREPGTSTDLAAIEQVLRQELPGYMIPARLMELESMPLTPNGKIDKKALPEPVLAPHLSSLIVLPKNKTEEMIMGLWTDILDVPVQSVQVSFLDLGGHSIKAITLISRLYQAFHIQVPVAVVFNEPTIEKLALYVDAHKHETTEDQQFYTIPSIEEKEFYETSGVQKRMFALYQNDPQSIHYNMPGVYHVHGHLDAEQLNKAFQALIDRHESLRTSFLVAEQGSVQKINLSIPFLLPVIYINDSLNQSQTEIATIIKDWIQPFDLSQAPLIRGGLIHLIDADILFMDMHHIISDAVSMGILLDDLRYLYEGQTLPSLSLYYKDFAEWQYAQLDGKRMKEHEAYWLKVLAGELPILSLPEDTKRFDMKQALGKNITLTLDKDLKQKIDDYIRPISVTPYMFYLAVFNILLSKHSGQTDIIVGSPAAARIHPGLDQIVGMFVNTLPMRNHLDYSTSFHNFLQEVRGNALEAFEHQEYDLIQLIEKLDIKKEKNRNLMLDVLFSVESMESSEAVFGGRVFSRYDMDYDLCKFDLSLDVFQDEQGKEDTLFNFNYNSGLFTARTMERFTKHYINLLKQIADNPYLLLKELSLLSQQEKEELRLFNSAKTDENQYETWQVWFEHQAALTPDNIAVSDASGNLSYKQLNQQANQLAHALRAEKVQPGTIVAVIADRSVYTIVGMLAVIKAGGTYMPVDPDYPKERILYMLENSQTDIILTKQSDAAQYSQLVSRCITYDSITEKPQWNTNPPVVGKKEDLMYIIYTSGTTGKPKAVMVEHQNVINISQGWIKDYRLKEMEVTLLQLASFSFDVSIGDICRSLLSGGKLIICPAETRTDPAALYQLIQSNKVTLFESTPGLIIPLMNYIYENQLPVDHLKLLILGSDICTAADFNTLYYRYGEQMRIINSYGITETTIDSSFFELNAGEKVESIHVPIGKPMQNSYFYILDQGYNELPLGVSGELYIGGAGVSRGYMNQQKLTEEKFVANPFVPGTLMYKTGDLARWLPEGNVELMGRIDQQVKVRGYRIELGEIESLLLSHPQIGEVAAVLSTSNQDLVCFVTCTSLLGSAEIRNYLEKMVPSYMIPSAFIILQEMPLTSNGKLDRRALSAMPVNVHAAGYAAPRDEVEILISGLWSDVLGKSRIGIDDPFFELGGHSLKAITLIFKIAGIFNTPVSVTDLFHHSTIRKLSAFIKEKRKLESESNQCGKLLEPIQQAEQAEFYPCSAVQRRLYAIYAQNPDSTAYNMPDIFVVEGKLDYNRLQSAFDALIQRHQALRTSFHHIDGKIMQHIQRQLSFQCPVIQLDTLQYSNIQQIVDEFVKPFQLEKSPLISARIVEWNGICLLMMDTHHIIGDGISTARLLEELSILYVDCDQPLPSLDLNYTDFAVWQNRQLEQGNFESDEKYWTKMLSGVLPQLQMPVDFKRTPEGNTDGALLRFDIPADLSEKVNKSLLHYGLTPYMFYLAAFQILLSRYSGQEDIITASPMVGRPDERLYQIVGMFLNTVPMRNQVYAHKTIRAFLNEVKENVLAAGEHQHYDLENLLSKVEAPYEAGRNRIFDTMFTLQNTDDTSFSLGEAVLTSYLHESRTAKFDISLFMIADSNNHVNAGVIEYKSSLYTPQTAGRWKEHLLKIVEQMIAEPAGTVGEIDILTPDEKSTFSIYNQTAGAYPLSITLNEQFEQQVKKTPLHRAVTGKTSSLSYEELNQRANQLAYFLQQSGIEADKPVAILMERSVNAVIAVLAVLKTGGACLPISMDYPEKRIEHILKDSSASLVLTDRVHALLKRINVPSLNMQENEWPVYPAANFRSNHTAENLAYIIYTSGTTGHPKGVMQTHRTLMNLVYEQYYHSDIDFSGSVVQFANIGFDVFFQEIFSALLAGGNLCVIGDEDKKDIPVLYDFIRVHQAQVLFLPTAYLKYIFSQPAYSAEFPAEIKHIITAGEALIVSDLLKEYICTHPVQLHNHYGPAETHVTTIYTMDQTNAAAGSVPIGTPIMNHASYIYNPSMQLQPAGVIGELYIAGHGVARGYLNNKQLTDDKFISNPSDPEQILYRTGDLARWNKEGFIEYMGRADQQVKIRGYRVEIADIQHQFMKYPGIQEVEIVLEDSSRLYAFFVADSAEINTQHIKKHLSNELPSYMVPSHMMQVENMPFTLNGKVDRKILMQSFTKNKAKEAVLQPMTGLEQQLLCIWQDVLKTDDLQLDDNFFEVGGNSLLVLTVLSKIEELYPDQLRVADIFMYPTIGRLAAFIDIRSQASISKKRAQLLGTPLPESYAVHTLPNNNNTSFEFTFEKEDEMLLDQICEKEQINLKLLILCISSFTMHKVFKQNECTMYYGKDQTAFITPLSFDFGSIGNFTDLFYSGQQQLSSMDESLKLDMHEQETWLSPDNKLVTAILDNQAVIQFKTITQKLDFVLSVDYEHDALVVKASYHLGKIQKSQAAELFRHIIHTATMLINKVKS